MPANETDLLDGVSAGANGSGSWMPGSGDNDMIVRCTKTFGGATVTIEGTPDTTDADATYPFTGGDLPFTAAGSARIILGRGHQVRATISGAGGSTDLVCKMTEMARD